MISQAAKLQNGRIILPRELQKTWREGEIFIFPSKDVLLIKKVQRPLSRLSDLASRISSPTMSRKEIEKEIQAYRKDK